MVGMIITVGETMKKKRIGFVSYWGWGRGQSYVTLSYVKMIKDVHDVYILKQGTNTISEEFKIPNIHVTECPTYQIPDKQFEEWILDNKLDAVIFNEYLQWEEEFNPLLDICKSNNVKCFYYLVLEKMKDKSLFEEYDRIIVPTKSGLKHMRKHQLRKFSYIPYGIDINEYEVEYPPYEPFIFYHPGGWGGVYDRKNTEVVVSTFKQLRDEFIETNQDLKLKLIITTQRKELPIEPDPDIEVVCKDMPKKELNSYYKRCHVVLLPSKWETLGIPFIEALTSGKPVITVDAEPMNELVVDNTNGFVCKCSHEFYSDIHVPGNLIHESDFKNKMNLILNREIYNILARNARKLAEENFDIKINKQYLLDFIEKYVRDEQ